MDSPKRISADQVRIRGAYETPGTSPALFRGGGPGEDLEQPEITTRIGQWVELTDEDKDKVSGEIVWETASHIQVRIGPVQCIVVPKDRVKINENAIPPKGRDRLMGRY